MLYQFQFFACPIYEQENLWGSENWLAKSNSPFLNNYVDNEYYHAPGETSAFDRQRD